MMVFKGIIFKLWLAMIVLLISVLAALGAGMFKVVENFYYAQIKDNLASQGQEIIKLYLEDEDRFLDQNEVDRYSLVIDAHILIVNNNGIIRICNRMTHIEPGTFLQENDLSNILDGNIVIKREFQHHFDTQMLTIGLPIPQSGEAKEALLIYTPVALFSEKFQSLKELMLLALVISILFSSVMAFYISRFLTKPLIKMNQVALDLARGDFSQRVTVDSRDELGVLGASLNYLSEELKKNMSELSAEKEKIERILLGMSDGVISFDTQGKIIHFNHPAKKLLACCPDFEENKIIDECDHLSQLKGVYDTLLRTKEPVQQNVVVGERTLIVRLSALADQTSGEVTGVIAVLYDITKEHLLEEMRKEFIANVSHELRTPISLIQGYAEAIYDGVGDSEEQQQEFAKTILDESHRLNRMVEDLLELSRIQSGAIDIFKESVDIRELALSVKNRFKKELTEGSTELIIETDPKAEMIWADSFRFEQIISNLLSNALRHSQGGLINLGTKQKDSGIEIIVRDNGEGIPEEDLPYIFERFYRVDRSRNREKGGTGLGLAIVKNLVEAHGGRISVQSKQGEGTMFIMVFPV